MFFSVLSKLVKFASNLPTWFQWTLLILYMAVIYYASSKSSLPAPSFFMADKLYHFVAYAILGGLWLSALDSTCKNFSPRERVLIAIVLTLAYGASDELHQLHVPGRVASVGDLVADLLGATFGTIYYRYLEKLT